MSFFIKCSCVHSKQRSLVHLDKIMNGISLVMSKSCCPMSLCTSSKIKFGTSSKIKFGTSSKMDLIPHRLSNLHRERMSTCVATRRVWKHGVYAASRVDVTGSKSTVPPEVSSAVVRYVLLSVGIIGMAFGIALATLKSNTCCYILLGVISVSLATGFFRKIWRGFGVIHNDPFSVGEIIQVGYLKGQVMEMGLLTTSLFTAENRREVFPTSWLYGQVIKNRSRGITIIPNTLLRGEGSVNKSRAPYHSMVSKIPVQVDDIGKILEITEEIMKMMRSNSNVHLEEEQPYCYLSEVKSHYVELSLKCNLQQMSEDKLYLSKQDVLLQSALIIEKHGATLNLEEWK